ncbi:MAG TPA: hypothetical protein VKU38_15030 [Ktedonobacteraceae bacterium]|nr:hypothetical protein [Ktedonobacteraceae bacterium]
MAKRKLREFPPTQPHTPWPTIYVSPEDRRYMPLPETRLGRHARRLRASLDLLLLDLGMASAKGALLGLFVFAVIYSYYNLEMQGFYGLGIWLWVIVVAGLLALLMLVGLDFTIMILMGITLWLSFPAIFRVPLILLLCLGCGVVSGSILEFFPRGRWRFSS